jgi:hypothetical protein
MAAKLFDMADNDPRPPVIVEYSLSWPGVDGSESDTVEIPRDEWDAMTPAQRVAECEQIANEAAYNRFSWGWNIEDADDYAATGEPT